MISATMRYDWRVAVAVALGVATATAVIVGALLVGDSMRGSLRELTIDRLGRIETAIIPGMFFEFAGIAEPDLGGAPLILFESGVVESKQPDGSVRRTGLVQVIGCDDSFWKLQINPEDAPTGILDDQSVILNEATAIELGVREGDQVTVRLPKEQAVPADSPLGRRESESEGLPRMRVARIIADRGFGRFSLAPNQASPRNVFLNRETVAQALDRPGQANIMLFDRQISADALRIRLRDLGLAVREVRKAHPGADGSSQTVFNYFSLTSDRLLLPEVAVQRILREFSPAEVAPVSTYLANAIEQIDEDGQVIASVPYSIMTAMDARDDFPLDFTAPEDSELGGRIPVVLNSWAADRLKASRGTRLRVAFFEPEVENGQEVERTFEAIVTSVVPITEPSAPYRRRQEPTFDQPPTVYNDPDLTPTVPGVTDQDSINDWDLPFQLNREISRDDDAYWNNHRLTPKLFMALRDGERLFASRFGRTTGLRFTGDVAADRESLEQRLMATLTPVLPELGWSPRLIRQQQLAASRGTTPFDGLFLALSAFVIFSAVMLIAMLFRLGFVQRMRQYGMMLAVGWNRSRVGGLAMGEGLCIALAGVAVGMIGGVLYAIAVLWALRSWWVGAVTVPFLSFHWSARSLLIGSLAGWLVTAFTLWLSTRSLLRGSAQSLLAQRETDAGIGLGQSRGGTRARLLAGLIGLGALVLAAVGARAGGQLAAGAFVGGGMMLLIALLLALYVRLRQPRRITIGTDIGGYTLISLAMRSAARHPLRSTLTIGLMSSASFLIIAIAAFRLQPTDSGTGGFELIGQTAQPLYRDLRDKTVQAELLGADQKGMQGVVVQPWRLRPGQDASCNNLYQASQPTVLGVPESFSRTLVESSLPGFQWAASIQTEPNQTPWDALNRTASGSAEQPIPVVIDQNTAMWSLQMTRGIGERRAFQYRDGEPIHFEVVGLLANSMLQGKLLIGESNFEQLFPEVSGYRYFLFACDRREAAGVAKILENRLGDVGMDVSETHQVLSGMLAVQNTYLRTFQSLGALGLLLGTIGLAVAQLRSVLERRQELAVLRAIGFTRGRLSSVVMLETGGLLALGIGCGVLCAVLAVLPHAVLGGFLPPIGEPLLLTAVILGLGLLAGLLAVRRVATLPLLESLRSE
jgi:ABC-type lipoprotein release transport system permease subunit